MKAEEIAKKHYPLSNFDECKMGCMRCSTDDCELHLLSVKTLTDDIENYAAETLAELERVKEERDELRAFIQLFIETQRETYGNGIKTHLSMTTLSEKAQQLLTPKD